MNNRERDRLAEEYADFFSSSMEPNLGEAFKAGWDACDERAQGLIRALERVSEDNPNDIRELNGEEVVLYSTYGEAARKAIKKYRGKM